MLLAYIEKKYLADSQPNLWIDMCGSPNQYSLILSFGAADSVIKQTVYK
jgi:hypothetical protein